MKLKKKRIIQIVFIFIIINSSQLYAKDEITGSYCYSYGDSESKIEARKQAYSLAIRNAIESYNIYVISTSSVKNGILKDNIINSISATYLKNIQILELTENYQMICYKIKAVVSERDIKSLIHSHLGSINNLHNLHENHENSMVYYQKQINKYDKMINDLINQKLTNVRKKNIIKKIFQRKKIINNILQNDDITLKYTDRNYDENLAFVNFHTEPSNLDIYIDKKWIGQSPIYLYEIEAETNHQISIKGDPRYFIPTNINRNYTKFTRHEENIKVNRGDGQILLLSKKIIKRVIVDNEEVKFNTNKPIISVLSGNKHVIVSDGIFIKSFMQDIWTGDVIRKDINLTINDDISIFSLLKNSVPANEPKKDTYRISFNNCQVRTGNNKILLCNNEIFDILYIPQYNKNEINFIENNIFSTYANEYNEYIGIIDNKNKKFYIALSGIMINSILFDTIEEFISKNKNEFSLDPSNKYYSEPEKLIKRKIYSATSKNSINQVYKHYFEFLCDCIGLDFGFNLYEKKEAFFHNTYLDKKAFQIFGESCFYKLLLLLENIWENKNKKFQLYQALNYLLEITSPGNIDFKAKTITGTGKAGIKTQIFKNKYYENNWNGIQKFFYRQEKRIPGFTSTIRKLIFSYLSERGHISLKQDQLK